MNVFVIDTLGDKHTNCIDSFKDALATKWNSTIYIVSGPMWGKTKYNSQEI
jgi:hypothetical protein